MSTVKGPLIRLILTVAHMFLPPRLRPAPKEPIVRIRIGAQDLQGSIVGV